MNTFMQKLGVLAAMLSTFLSVFAYDFEADGIYYNITDPTAKEVEVTYGSYGEFYSGDIVVPSSVSYHGDLYTVASIGVWAFSDCIRLTSITIPNSVTSIGWMAFSGCSSLTAITIPNSVTSIGNRAFSGCRSLTSITLPNSVTSIGDYAFDGCSSLTSITLPNSVTSIGKGAFYRCSSLTSITLPNSVTSIGEEAFYWCSSLTSITSLAVMPPACEEGAFEDIDKQKCTLYVPAGSVEAYKQAHGWKDFVLVEAVEAGIDSVAAGTADGVTEVFNLTGAKVADSLENLPAGIYLVREGSTIRKIAVR